MHLSKLLAAAAGTSLLAAAQVALPTSSDAIRADTDADRSTFTWGDFDNDGLRDAFVAQPGAAGRLLRNTGDGGFEDVTVRAGLGAVPATALARWADYDADGRQDLFLGAEGGASSLWRNRGDGSFEPASDLAGIDVEGAVLAARFFDYDDDGRTDLLVRTALERKLYHNQGGGTFALVDLGLPQAPAVLNGASVVATGTGTVRAGGAAAATPVAPTARGDAGAPDRGRSGGRVEARIGGIVRAPNGSQGLGTGVCVDGLFDQSGGTCLNASRVPALDMLFPMSTALNVNAATDFVGMGTTTPSTNLHVFGTGVDSEILAERIGGAQVKMQAFGSTASIGTNNSHDLRLVTNNSVRMTLDTAGNAGIGDVSPDGKLEVRQTGGGDILNLYDSTTNVVSVLDGGNVGIGNTAPTTKLHVSGPNDSQDGPTLQLSGTLGNQFEGGRVRMTELGSFVGGYMHYDAAGNRLNLGTHPITGSNPADDVDAISILRATEPSVGVGTIPSTSVVLNVLSDDSDDGLRATNTSTGSAAVFETTNSGNFNPVVVIDHNGLAPALDVTSTLNGNAARFEKTSTTSTASTVICDNDGLGTALFASQSSLTSFSSALDVRSFSNNNRALNVISNNSGDAAFFFCNDTAGTGDGIETIVRGSGVAGKFESATGATMTLNRTDNAGNIFEVANSTDIEFRVESSGNVFCDGSFTGGGADYAEWLERADYDEELEPGDVVGVRGGRISKDLDGAEQILVLSSNPALVGNASGAEDSERDGFEVTAFLGQVPVKVLGAVASGDFLVPSGRDDGTAVAVSPAELDFTDLGRAFAAAWEDADDDGLHLVNAAVGLDQAAAVEALVARLHAEIERRDATLADLGGQVAGLLDRMAALESDRAPVARR